MKTKFVWCAVLACLTGECASADPKPAKEPVDVAVPILPAQVMRSPGVGSIWGHTTAAESVSQGPVASLCSDRVGHALGDLVTIVVDLQNTISKNQNTTTGKTTAVAATINSLVYPNDGTSNGWNFLNYHGQPPTTSWNSSQSFNGGGSVANQETASTTIEAQIVNVEPNGVFRLQAFRHSKAGNEDTSMVLTGLIRREDLSATNTIASSRVLNLEIIQKGKGSLSENQRKGWLTKFYEFITPF